MNVPNIIIHTQTEAEIKAVLVEEGTRVTLDMPSSGSINYVSYAEMHRLADWIKENVPTKPPVKLPTEQGSVIRVVNTAHGTSAVWMLTRDGWVSEVYMTYTKVDLERLINNNSNLDIELIR